jgi:hypothetical protein
VLCGTIIRGANQNIRTLSVETPDGRMQPWSEIGVLTVLLLGSARLYMLFIKNVRKLK